MARTRAQRRRHTLFITLALVVTLIVLVFARDVSRAAHGAVNPRRSENRSFAALANSLVTNENAFDKRLHVLLVQGSSLSRVVFDARLSQLAEVLPAWTTTAEQLRRPTLAHDVNNELGQLTIERVAAYEALLASVARTLSLPWSATTTSTSTSPSASLLATSKSWNFDRYALVKEPGRAHLYATNTLSATYVATSGLSDLSSSTTLRLVRAVGIAALRVTPSALPAATGELLLPPVTSVGLAVSVLNASFDDQPVSLSIRVTPLNHRGDAFSRTMTTTLGPLQAYGFTPGSLVTAPSERARVVLTLSGARAAVGMKTTESFELVMSPSGGSATD